MRDTLRFTLHRARIEFLASSTYLSVHVDDMTAMIGRVTNTNYEMSTNTLSCHKDKKKSLCYYTEATAITAKTRKMRSRFLKDEFIMLRSFYFSIGSIVFSFVEF